jgi:uncharacterized protein (TIGR02118 family)
MYKVMILIKRKPGISKEEFFKHYDEVHAPAAMKDFPQFVRYERNYVLGIVDPPSRSHEEPEFDCITEIWYKDRKAFEDAESFWTGEGGKVILADNETFMDVSKMVSYAVEQKVAK